MTSGVRFSTQSVTTRMPERSHLPRAWLAISVRMVTRPPFFRRSPREAWHEGGAKLCLGFGRCEASAPMVTGRMLCRPFSSGRITNPPHSSRSCTLLKLSDRTGIKREVWVQATRSDMTSDVVQRAFFVAVSTIGSDGDRKNVLTSVLRTPNLPPSLLTGVAQAAKGIGSDGDKASVLTRVTEFQINDGAARSAFFAAVNSIGSDGDRAEVLSGVLKNPAVAPETAAAAIEGAMGIGSDGDKASLLVLAAERHGSSPIVRWTLEKALRSVHSDGDYRRVVEAIRR